jgi:hypothetical protein
MVYASSNSVSFADAFGLCPCGNPADVVDSARSDMRDWGQQSDRRDVNSVFGSGENKCNLFVDTHLENAGYNLPNTGGNWWSRLFNRYPPGAGELSKPDYNLPGWSTVSGPAQPGDLIAERGHVGIATSANSTISATRDGIIENNWGFRPGQDPVIRRCSCAQ